MKETNNSNKKVTKIDKDVVFKGSFKFQDKLTVFGKIYGNIESDSQGEVYIDSIGAIDGTVNSGTIENYGELKGAVKVDKYFLYSSGKSHCKLQTKEIMVEKGAKISGEFQMESDL